MQDVSGQIKYSIKWILEMIVRKLIEEVVDIMHKRPTGITIMASFIIFGGLGLAIMLFANYLDINHTNARSNIHVAFLNIIILFVVCIYLATGIGMLLHKKWGWYLGCLLSMNAILNDIYELIGDLRSYKFIELGYDILFGLFFSIFLFKYFFEKKVLIFFNLANLSKWKLIAILAILAPFAIGVQVFIQKYLLK